MGDIESQQACPWLLTASTLLPCSSGRPPGKATLYRAGVPLSGFRVLLSAHGTLVLGWAPCALEPVLASALLLLGHWAHPSPKDRGSWPLGCPDLISPNLAGHQPELPISIPGSDLRGDGNPTALRDGPQDWVQDGLLSSGHWWFEAAEAAV